jgi:hypothetical protein
MNKLFAFVLIGPALGLSVVSIQAMPFRSNQTQDSLVVPVSGGCGIGFHRGPYGGCRANGYYGGPVVVAPPVYYGGPGYYAPVGPCGGRGQHRVCGVNGGCVMVCN